MYLSLPAATLGLALLAAPGDQAEAVPDWSHHPVNQWVRRSPAEGRPSPGFSYEGSAAYDPRHRLWIHHGGHDGIPQGFHTFTFDLDTGVWEQRFPPTSPGGACCIDGDGAFDAASGRFVRFPGGTLGHGFQWSRGVHLKGSAVWLYDPAGGAWMDMRPPPYRVAEKYSREVPGGLNGGAIYDPTDELVLTFGGQSAGGDKNALFAYDAHANELHRLPGRDPPPERDGMGIAYDAARDKLVVFGGQYLTDARTWTYDLKTGRWEGRQLDPHPPTEKVTKDYSTIPRLAYDPLHGVVLCLAWLGEEGHETWALEGGGERWRKLAPAVEPEGSKSRSRNLDFDPERNVFILETSSAKTGRPEVWTYRFADAPPPAAAPAAPAAPEGLEVTTETGGKARLAWKAVPGAKEYRVYRAEEGEPGKSDFASIGSAAGLDFEDQGLEAGKTYLYRVRAVDGAGTEGPASRLARTRPRILSRPVASVLAPDRVEVAWQPSPASDVVGYNLYRGLATVRTVRKGTPGAWRDNDPEYAKPQVVEVLDITGLKRLNERPLAATRFADEVDLRRKGPEAGDYRYAVYAYIVRAVNRLDTESGPSPYALTIPSEPRNVLCRERGETAELKWDPAAESGIAGYHVYKLEGTWSIVRVTPEPIRGTTFEHRAGAGPTRYWVVTVDALGQEGQPSSPAWFGQAYRGFFAGEWHQ